MKTRYHSDLTMTNAAGSLPVTANTRAGSLKDETLINKDVSKYSFAVSVKTALISMLLLTGCAGHQVSFDIEKTKDGVIRALVVCLDANNYAVVSRPKYPNVEIKCIDVFWEGGSD